MFTPHGKAKCKTCKCEIDAGEIRCAEHERQFKRWLAGADSSDRRAGYVPRFNGIHGVENDEEYVRRKRIAFSLVPGLRPEQPLKFD